MFFLRLAAIQRLFSHLPASTRRAGSSLFVSVATILSHALALLLPCVVLFLVAWSVVLMSRVLREGWGQCMAQVFYTHSRVLF